MRKKNCNKAHEYANYVRNRSPTKALTRSTPNKTFYGRKPSVSTLHIFRSHCHVHVPPELRRKLDSHSVDGILCGFKRGSKAYRVCVTIEEAPISFSPFSPTDCTLCSHFSFDDFIMIAFLDITRDLDDQM